MASTSLGERPSSAGAVDADLEVAVNRHYTSCNRVRVLVPLFNRLEPFESDFLMECPERRHRVDLPF